MSKYFTKDNKMSPEKRLSFVLNAEIQQAVYMCLIDRKLEKLSIEEIQQSPNIKKAVKEIKAYITSQA